MCQFSIAHTFGQNCSATLHYPRGHAGKNSKERKEAPCFAWAQLAALPDEFSAACRARRTKPMS
jgi:hypothetical protein